MIFFLNVNIQFTVSASRLDASCRTILLVVLVQVCLPMWGGLRNKGYSGITQMMSPLCQPEVLSNILVKVVITSSQGSLLFEKNLQATRPLLLITCLCTFLARSDSQWVTTSKTTKFLLLSLQVSYISQRSMNQEDLVWLSLIGQIIHGDTLKRAFLDIAMSGYTNLLKIERSAQ